MSKVVNEAPETGGTNPGWNGYLAKGKRKMNPLVIIPIAIAIIVTIILVIGK